MSALWTIVATAFVLVVLAALAYGVFVLVSGRRHFDQFRDPGTGGRRGASPHLELHDEFERTHDTGSPHLESRDESEHTHVGVT